MFEKSNAERDQEYIATDLHICTVDCDEGCDVDGLDELTRKLDEIDNEIMTYFKNHKNITDKKIIIKIINYFNQYDFNRITDHNYIKQMSSQYINSLLKILIEGERLDILYILENQFNYPFETLYQRDFDAVKEMESKDIQNAIVDSNFLERIVIKRFEFNREEKRREGERQQRQYGGYTNESTVLNNLLLGGIILASTILQ